jgi:hypothetical protein
MYFFIIYFLSLTVRGCGCSATTWNLTKSKLSIKSTAGCEVVLLQYFTNDHTDDVLKDYRKFAGCIYTRQVAYFPPHAKVYCVAEQSTGGVQNCRRTGGHEFSYPIFSYPSCKISMYNQLIIL